jgi:hypothetical protein
MTTGAGTKRLGVSWAELAAVAAMLLAWLGIAGVAVLIR